MRHREITPRGTWARGRRPLFQTGLGLGLPFAVLIGINVYVFFLRDTGSVRDLMQTSAVAKPAQAISAATFVPPLVGSSPSAVITSPPAVAERPLVVRGSLRGHSGLLVAVRAARVERRDADALIKALGPVLDMRSLRPEHTFVVELGRTSGRLERFTYRLSALESVEVTRRDGKLTVQRRKTPVSVRRVAVAARVETSLNKAISGAGEKTALLYRLINLFSWDINWSTDVRRGDELRLVVEKRYVGGRFVGYGKLIAAEYKGQRTGTVRAFYHVGVDGKGGHYSPHGRSLVRPLLKTPVSYQRISSQFDRRRFHPILHRVKAHLGVDYAAPTGTPVWAAGDGKVVWARRSGPAGKMVQIKHDSGIVTVYMHLWRFARGLKRGQRVRQRQVIGYVGTTGRSTGPHLHYGMKIGGRYVDPMNYRIPRGALLPRAERLRYLDTVSQRIARLRGLAPSERSKDVPQQNAAKGRTEPVEDDIWS